MVDELNELKEKLNHLESRIDDIAHQLTRAVNVARGYDELLDKHCKLHDQDIENIYGRVKNLEFKVFPHLARDIVQLYDVIGDGEDKADNPLDRRKPSDSDSP